MSIAKVQSVSGNGATLVLNGVVAANALIYASSYYRFVKTGTPEATPTDSNGTFSASSNDAPINNGTADIGASIFHEQNAASGTHTVTPEANTIHNCSLTEFSGLLTSGMFDVSKSASDSTLNHLSQGTGDTLNTAQSDELEIVALAVLQSSGGNPFGLTDPIVGTTTLKIDQNTATDIGDQHSFKVLYSAGSKSETFNWTTLDTTSSFGCIATFLSPTTGSGIGSSNLASSAGRYIGWTL